MKNEKELMNFCENVKALREMYGLGEAEMAKRMGVSLQTLRRIEKKDFPQKLSGEVLVRLCREFRTSASALLSDYAKSPVG